MTPLIPNIDSKINLVYTTNKTNIVTDQSFIVKLFFPANFIIYILATRRRNYTYETLTRPSFTVVNTIIILANFL